MIEMVMSWMWKRREKRRKEREKNWGQVGGDGLD
jgi:hypothetical protein